MKTLEKKHLIEIDVMCKAICIEIVPSKECVDLINQYAPPGCKSVLENGVIFFDNDRTAWHDELGSGTFLVFNPANEYLWEIFANKEQIFIDIKDNMV